MISRYTRPELGAIWTDQAKMDAWRDVEVAAAEALDGPTPQELSDAIEALVRAFEENMEQNSYLVSQLYFRYRDGLDVAELFSAADHYRAVTAAEVHAAAKKYLPLDRYVRVQLFPEKK